MAYQAHGRVICDCAPDFAQFLWRPPVVTVKERDPLPAAFGDTVIEGAGLATIGFTENANVRLELLKDLRRAVRGAVVYHQDLAVGGRKILGKDAVHGFFDEALVIVGVDQYADERSRHGA